MSINLDQVQTMIGTLPYMQKYKGKVVVVKYGGNAMIDETLKNAVISDIVFLTQIGIKVVLVHGGGPAINKLLKQIGKEPEFVNGLRVTDAETMDCVQMALCGKNNKDLVSMVQRAGGRAIGIGGMDGGLIKAVKLIKDGFDYGYGGEVVDIDPTIIYDIMDRGYIPIISTAGMGIDDDCHYNVNADVAAGKIAVALKADKLIMLTDVRGVLRNYKDETTLIPKINLSELSGLLLDGTISGGMIPKVEFCSEAVKNGVKEANIQDGRIPHSILLELLSDENVGTVFEL